MMWTVGITGISGSGKSSLTQYYRGLGFATEDGDKLSRIVCTPHSACLTQLREAFGPDIIDETGALKRRVLGEKVYGNATANKQLIDIVHPHILKEFLRRKHIAENRGCRFLFLDGAMIVGSIFEEQCKKLVLVESNDSQSIKRIVLRDGVSEAVAKSRLAAQKHIADLRYKVDFVVDNNDELSILYAQANDVLKQLEQLYTQDVPQQETHV